MKLRVRRAFALLACALSSVRAADAPHTGVRLTDQGDTFTMENGLVTAVIDKKKAEVKSIALVGGHNLVSRGGVTFDAEAFLPGPGKSQAALTPVSDEVVSSDPDLAELKFTQPDFIQFLGAEMHFVMRRGVPGIYTYLVLSHSATQPAGSVGQIRWVFRGDAGLLTHAFASATKQGRMISEDVLKGARKIADATYALDPAKAAQLYPEPTGRTHDGLPVYSKYDWTDTLENHVVHGFSSETEGIFMVQPSLEYYNGGPSKGVLTVHNGPVAILEFLGGHFLMRSTAGLRVSAGQEWRQIIGPWLTYVNKGANPAELWRDAAARGQQEKAAWPYAWVTASELLYPRTRGTVTGSLVLPGRKAANALVVLAAPDRDWQAQAMGYEFWTRADADGRFTLPKVRPGDYALYASVPGVVGELKIDRVHVTAGGTTRLDPLRWQPPARRQLLWRIGTPDRSAAEFRFGDRPRQFGLWWRYLEERGTRPLDYTIGKSDPAKDWYYAQCAVALPDGSYFGPTWNIHFDQKGSPPSGPLLLTLDLAGVAGNHPRLIVSVNGREVGALTPENDSGIYRSAVQSSNFRHHTIEFDSALLKPGANTVSLQLEARGLWKQAAADAVIETEPGVMPETPSAGIMYDCIQLEGGTAIDSRVSVP